MTCSGTTTASSTDGLSPNSQSKTDSWTLESGWNQEDPSALHKGFDSIATSLSLLTKTLGVAIEEHRHLVKSKAFNPVHKEPQSPKLQKASDNVLLVDGCLVNPSSLQTTFEKGSPVVKNKQMKGAQELAIAMTTKAKFLLHQLKGVKQDLVFSRERCSHLEEENKRLRESMDKGDRHEDDDLVRLQLEALLAEKARLAQENSTYAREVQFLQELVQYQQLKWGHLAVSDEGLMFDDEELNVDADDVDVHLLPLYNDENENNDMMQSPSACQAT